MNPPRSAASPTGSSEPADPSLGDELPVGMGVRLIYVGAGPPAFVPASVAAASGTAITLNVAAPWSVDVGVRLILEPVAGGGLRHVVIVTEVVGRTLTARLVATPPRDRREYPRLRGRLSVRYRIAQTETDTTAWLGGAPFDGSERTPAPHVDFSATGIAFEDEPFARESDRLLLEVGIPRDHRRWRCTGRVVRVVPADRGAQATIAVQLEHAPPEATLALVRYTLRLQEALMDGYEDP
ncbi:MAG: PilZ domain-containing protein [Pseudomonadota bacterium]|nr:PilZ domain-containing protein [Pseudomonadota bacterium]